VFLSGRGSQALHPAVSSATTFDKLVPATIRKTIRKE
jgi:hypothetical protein